MKTTHTITALFIVLLGSAVHIVWAKPAQAAEFKQKLAEFQQATKAVEKKGNAAVSAIHAAFQSARGLAHSKTWRTFRRACDSRSVLDCPPSAVLLRRTGGSPLPLFPGNLLVSASPNPNGIPSRSPRLPSRRG